MAQTHTYINKIRKISRITSRTRDDQSTKTNETHNLAGTELKKAMASLNYSYGLVKGHTKMTKLRDREKKQ